MFKTYDATLPFWNQMNYPLDLINFFWSNVNIIKKEDGSEDFDKCWEWTGNLTNRINGYPRFRRNNIVYHGHRFSYSCFNGPITPNYFVCHSCDNTKCVNPYHLWEGTQKDNSMDRDNKNRNIKGSDHKLAVLHESKVKNILDGIIDGTYKTGKQIVEKYGIGNTTLRNILYGHRWKHVSKNYDLNKILLIINDMFSSDKTVLSKDDVLEIVKTYNTTKISQEDLAIKYGVSKGCISNIILGRNWNNITGIDYIPTGIPVGSKSKRAKLNEKQVLEIRKRLECGELGKDLAKEFGVGEMTISRIRHRQRWSHI